MAEVDEVSESFSAPINTRGSRKKFSSVADAKEWLAAERSEFSRLTAYSNKVANQTSAPYPVQNVATALLQHFDGVKRMLDLNPVQAFASHYGAGQLFVSSSSTGRFILEASNPLRSLGRYAGLTDASFPLIDQLPTPFLAGFAEGSSYGLIPRSDRIRELEDELSALLANSRTSLESLADSQRNRLELLHDEESKKLTELRKDQGNQWSRFIKDTARKWTSHLESLEVDTARMKEAADISLRGVVLKSEEKLNDFTSWISSVQEDISGKQEEMSSKQAEFDRYGAEVSQQFKDRLGEVDESLIDWEKKVKERLAFEAPMTFWDTKAQRHRRNAWLFGIATTAFALLMGFEFFQLVRFIFSEAAGFTGTDATDYTRLAVLLFLATLGVWFLRILVRVLLSEAHLQNDAREREVMLKTFTALDAQEEKKLSEEDRRLLLAYVFRPAATGIVHDDSAPLSVPELLSRINTKS